MSEDYRMVLTPEVASRLSPKRFELPYLSVTDVMDYIKDVFEYYRDPKTTVKTAFSPFSKQVVQQFAEFLYSGLYHEITPRRVNQAFSELLGYVQQSALTEIQLDDYKKWISQRGDALLEQLR